MDTSHGKKGPFHVHKLRNAASKFWLQIPLAAVAALALALTVTSYIGLGSEADASDFSADKSQHDALSDGVVTQGEYNSAINRTQACVRAAGGQVIGDRYEDYRNVPVRAFAVNEPGVEPGGVSIYDGCWMKFSRDVEYAWVQQEAKKITPERRVADEKAALECAIEENLDATSVDELRELGRSGAQVNGDVFRCITIANEGFDPEEHPSIRVD